MKKELQSANDALVSTPALYGVIATVLLVVVTRRTGVIFIFFTEKELQFKNPPSCSLSK